MGKWESGKVGKLEQDVRLQSAYGPNAADAERFGLLSAAVAVVVVESLERSTVVDLYNIYTTL